MTTKHAHLGPHHRLAAVVRQRCRQAGHPQIHGSNGMAGVGCGSCWEAAIRADERLRIEEQLPAECPPDPLLIDEVAVERFCAGEAGKPQLTRPEKVEAARRLIARNVPLDEIRRRLALSSRIWRQILAAANGDLPVQTVLVRRADREAVAV
ncbi:hypothetical protein [Stackebrandtia nassauensis]|nr:hypothetical protein [Stackebrandtia nassauensis]